MGNRLPVSWKFSGWDYPQPVHMVYDNSCTIWVPFRASWRTHVILLITVPNSICGKVMFSQACIIFLSTVGGMRGKGRTCVVKGAFEWQRGHAWWREACVAKGGMHREGGHVWWRETCMVKVACMAKGSMHAKGGVHDDRGVCVAKGGHAQWRWGVWWGACMVGGMHGRGHAWQCGMHCRETTTAVDSTHPTGMHYCYDIFSVNKGAQYGHWISSQKVSARPMKWVTKSVTTVS